MDEYITPNYETIGVQEKREIMQLVNSSLINAFSYDDYYEVIGLFRRIVERLEAQENE